MSGARISVYVPCYNAAPYLARVLQGIFAQTLPADEVIVVDDGSRDGSREIAGRFPVTLICHDQNRGLAAARNTAVKAARNELVAALDSDVVPDADWLERLAPHFDDQRVALGGGKLVEAVDRTVADRWRAVHMRQHWGDSPLENPSTVFGANTMLRRSAALEAGGYDERMRTNGEDGYIHGLLRRRGWKSFYEPAAVGRHLREDTVETALETFWRYRPRFPDVLTVSSAARLLRFEAHCSARAVWWDVRDRRWALLGMDALMLPVAFRSDLRAWRSKREPKLQPSAARSQRITGQEAASR